jgi:hypothetical protein
MKNRIVLLLIILLLLLIILSGIPTSYYDSKQENPREQLENFLKQPNVPVIVQASIKRALSLKNKDLDKGLELAKRSNTFKSTRTIITLIKLAVAGDLRKFINSIDKVDTVDEQTLVAKAKASLAPDIKTYRMIIDLLLQEPKQPEQLSNGLKSLQKLNDRKLVAFGRLIEDEVVAPQEVPVLISNPEKLSKGLDDIIKPSKMGNVKERNRAIISSIIQTSQPVASKVFSSSSSM